MADENQKEVLQELQNTLNKLSESVGANNNPVISVKPQQGFAIAYFAPGIIELTRGLSRLIRDYGGGTGPYNPFGPFPDGGMDPGIPMGKLWQKIRETIRALADFIDEIAKIWEKEP
jgi:hypothetical protein